MLSLLCSLCMYVYKNKSMYKNHEHGTYLHYDDMDLIYNDILKIELRVFPAYPCSTNFIFNREKIEQDTKECRYSASLSKNGRRVLEHHDHAYRNAAAMTARQGPSERCLCPALSPLQSPPTMKRSLAVASPCPGVQERGRTFRCSK